MGDHAAFKLKVSMQYFHDRKEMMTGNNIRQWRQLGELYRTTGLEIVLFLRGLGFVQNPGGDPLKLGYRDV
jgi:hypothetical protein